MKTPIALFAALLLTQGAAAQTAPAPVPAGVSKDPSTAPAGAYKMDPDHTAILARVGHRGGLSFSLFRFNATSGSLNWNPADLTKAQLSVSVDMKSIQTPVPDFASALIGDRFLKTAQYPEAKFVSTSVQRTGTTSGKILGNLTFMGQTKPVTIDAAMVGTTLVKGNPVIGFSGKLRFKRSDFGFSGLTGPISDDIELTLDVEFDKTT